MAEQAYAYVTLIPVAKGFQKGIANELGGIGELGDKAGTTTGLNFKEGFSKAVKVGLAASVTAALGGAAVGKFMSDVIGSASALFAEFEGVNQVFGTAAVSVQKFAETASRTVGLTETAALQASKSFGVFATAAGLSGQGAASFATNLVQAAGDMASFNDVPVEEALAAIKSGLQGQGEPLARFGILMNENTLKAAALKAEIIDSTDAALTPQQKVLAANALLFQELGVQQGDFGNYQDTFGNKLKTVTAVLEEMRTEIGQGLLPQAENMLAVFEESILPIFEDLGDAVLPMLASWMGVITQVLEDAGDPTTFFGQAVETLTESFSTLMEVLTVSEDGMDTATNSLGSIANAIALVTDTLASFIAFMDTIGPAFEALLSGDFATFADWLTSDPIEWRRLNVEVNYKNTGDMPIFGPMTGSGSTLDFLQGMGMGGVSQTPVITPKTFGSGGQKDDTKAQLQKVIKDTRDAFKQARRDYRDEVKEIRADFNQSQKDIAQTYSDTVAAATERFNDASVAIAKRYNDQVSKANKKRDESLASALKDHNKRISEIQADFAKRQADIVQQSMDRLRDAYKSAVSINVASIFDSDELAGSIEGTVQVMREKLLASQQLLDNAAKLNAMGFSQTFIEQVVASGTDLGNELANSILGATPDTIAELKSLYGQLESQSETAMDSLAQTIYDENGLATSELKDLYSATQTELTLALEQQALAYKDTLTQINADFNQSIADAELARTEALADAQTALDDAILAAKTARDKALQETENDLQAALLKAAKNFDDDITKIEKTFKDKIASMKGEVGSLSRAISDLMNQLAGAKTAVANAAPTPKVKLAQGGLVTGPTNALIGEAGPEVVIPLDKFESMMGMGSGGQAINYYAAPNQSLDSEKELFQAMKRAKVVVGW
jgi:hypothetical protein